MLSDSIIVGLVLLLCAILEAQAPFFKTETGLLWIKFIVFFAVGGFSVLNGILFGNDELSKTVILQYLSSGLSVGSSAAGIFSLGEAAINANKAIQAKRKQRKEQEKEKE